jgi:uncharacterized membrane-anchored protein YitT (DUF2179 family)
MQPISLIDNPRVRDYVYIIAGMAIFAVGFTALILPHHIVVGGMAGFATLVFFASGEHLPVGFTMLTVNFLMLACGYRVLGRSFVVRTIFGATLLSLMIGAIEDYFTSNPPIIVDPTMSVMMGAVICGVGIGVYYSHDGSSGGTDIVAALLDKAHRISVGRTMIYVDVTIVALSFFLPFEGDWNARVQARVPVMLYGWASIVIYSYIADRIVNAPRRANQFLIISSKWEEIAHAVAHEARRGVTKLQAEGYWTGQDRMLLMVWCRQSDAARIYDIVRRIDTEALVIQSEARSLYGEGFDPLTAKIDKSRNQKVKKHTDAKG